MSRRHDVARVGLVALAEHHGARGEAPGHRHRRDLLQLLGAERLERRYPGEQLHGCEAGV